MTYSIKIWPIFFSNEEAELTYMSRRMVPSMENRTDHKIHNSQQMTPLENEFVEIAKVVVLTVGQGIKD